MTRIAMLTTAQTAERLGVSERTLKRWRGDIPVFGLPPIRLGGRVMYAEADVNGWLLRQRGKGRDGDAKKTDR